MDYLGKRIIKESPAGMVFKPNKHDIQNREPYNRIKTNRELKEITERYTGDER
jgi:hypothetical protein